MIAPHSSCRYGIGVTQTEGRPAIVWVCAIHAINEQGTHALASRVTDHYHRPRWVALDLVVAMAPNLGDARTKAKTVEDLSPAQQEMLTT